MIRRLLLDYTLCFFRESDPIETLQGEKKRGIIDGDKLPAGNLPAIKIRSPHRPPKK